MSLAGGTYIIRPKDTPNQALLVGPVPRILPPPDVPLKVSPLEPDNWSFKAAENDTYIVFTGGGTPNDYKWVQNDDNRALLVSAVRPPGSFRFERAGDDDQGPLYTIGLFGENLLLTYGGDEIPQLTFEPANGSSAQHFVVIPIFRD